MTDWHDWLRRYDRPNSPHSLRLRTVQRLIGQRLDRLAPEPVQIVSICAGDGRDVLGVLRERDDASRVRGTLVELDPRLCALARTQAAAAGLDGIEIREADAGATDTYVGVPPADLVLLIGVFGNIGDADVRTTIEMLPALCRPRALVVWSLRQQARQDRTGPAPAGRRNDQARVDRVGAWFAQSGFTEVFANRRDMSFHVGAHRLTRSPVPLEPGRMFFKFEASSDDPSAEA